MTAALTASAGAHYLHGHPQRDGGDKSVQRDRILQGQQRPPAGVAPAGRVLLLRPEPYQGASLGPKA